MKKTILLLLALSVGFVAQAQEKQWSFGFEASPNFSLFQFHDDGGSNSELTQLTEDLHKGDVNYGVYLIGEKKLSENSSFTIGIGIQRNGDKTDDYFVYPGETTPWCGTGMPTYNSTEHAYHIEVPLNYKRYLGNKVYTKLGASGLYNFRNTTTLITKHWEGNKDNNTEVIEDENLRTLNAYLNFGVGYDFYQNEKLKVYLEPHAQYAIANRYSDALINQRVIVFGLSTGIKF